MNKITPSKRLLSVALASAFICSSMGIQAASGASFTRPQASVVASPRLALKEGAVIGKLYVPRFGQKYMRTILEGTSHATLNNKAGLGHYKPTQMVGDVGNFAIAGHRFANGGPMLKIDKLRMGDLAFVKTSTKWFTYKMVGTKTVKPSMVGVVYPVPVGLKTAVEGGSYMTFTSCTPIHVNTHRIAVWFELVKENPVSEGMPTELAAFLGK